MIRRATSSLDSCGYGDHSENGAYDYDSNNDYNINEDYDEDYSRDLDDNNYEYDDEKYHHYAADYEHGPAVYEPHVDDGIEERSAAGLGPDMEEADRDWASSSHCPDFDNPDSGHDFGQRRKRRRETS